ncbi:hypothetical protein [Luteolibacter marinus]|uniref:hypothetical protein n=1 Tax=Luteolibacter marinus TaxID=2776705 RepID=UPI001866BB2B|nr:hypothetical protein [Luteolibacter marinus]
MANKLRRSNLVFQLSCWMLGLIAFAQLLTAGVALAARMERAQEVRIVEKVVPKIVTIAQPVVAKPPPAPPVTAALPPMPDPTPLPPPRPRSAPPIADPVVERLVVEARAARVLGDNMSAITKLESAKELAPKDPSVIYELGLTWEGMAAYDLRLADQASDCFLEVMQMNTDGAGALYELAAEKLREGIAMPDDLRGEMALGRVRIFKDDKFDEGERVIVTAPVQVAPGTTVDGQDIEVRVTFFETVRRDGKDQIEERADGFARVTTEFPTLPFDFAVGEELVRVTYLMPSQELRQEHLFGRRNYYGQVVELLYKGEVIDTQAWPRHLSSRSAVSSRHDDSMPQFLTEDMIEIDPANPLLPTREGEYLPDLPSYDSPGDMLPPPPED